MTTTHVWMNYDLGVQGDYTGLYTWLDGMGAMECADSTAFFTLDIGDGDDIFALLRDGLEEAVELSTRSRIYVFCSRRGRIRAGFVVGKRKRAPWEGYAAADTSEDDVNDDDD